MILAIYGSGGAGREILELARQIEISRHRWDNIVFINDFCNEKTKIHDIPVFPFVSFQNIYSPDTTEIVISLGEPSLRKILWDKILSYGYSCRPLIHPNVFIPETTSVGNGCILCKNSFISCDVHIGENTYLQQFCSITHDDTIQSHSVVSSFCSIAGNCSIGSETYLGLNSSIREKIHIGSRSIIGMGSSVVNDIPDDVVAWGSPARVIRSNDTHRVFK